MKQFLPSRPQPDSREFDPQLFVEQTKAIRMYMIRDLAIDTHMLAAKINRLPRGVVSLADQSEAARRQSVAEQFQATVQAELTAMPVAPSRDEEAAIARAQAQFAPTETTPTAVELDEQVSFSEAPSQAEEDAVARAQASVREALGQ